MASKPSRSTNGCHTCKRRRKKCDESRPVCNACTKLSIECEGYDKRLVWGYGLASRGKLRGAAMPAVSKTKKVHERDEPMTVDTTRQHRRHQERPSTQSDHDQINPQQEQSSQDFRSCDDPSQAAVAFTFTPDESGSQEELAFRKLSDRLMLDFFTSGHHSLYSASKDDSPVLKTILPMCRTSLMLRSVCVAYQALISHHRTDEFQTLYDIALQRFQADVADPNMRNEDSTIAAGILLCSIGASQGLPWTFHIDPLLDILTNRPDFALSPFHSHALDIMGYYDLPSFVMNRKHARRDIWQTYCMNTNRLVDEIEPVSGLPRSLLDIFSGLEAPDCEEKLWLWPGLEGDVTQIYLWDAFRFSGMLKHRELKDDCNKQPRDVGLDDHETKKSSSIQLPSDAVLLNRLTACLNVLHKLNDDHMGQSLVMNAILYPLFVAGCQTKLLAYRPGWRNMIHDLLNQMIDNGKRQVEPLRDILLRLETDRTADPDQLAAEMGLEIALL